MTKDQEIEILFKELEEENIFSLDPEKQKKIDEAWKNRKLLDRPPQLNFK